MKNTNYEWTENKVSNIASIIGVWIFILAFLSSLLVAMVSIFTDIEPWISIVVLMSGLLLAVPFLLVYTITSTKNKYTRKFIDKIEDRIPKCKTLPELWELYNYFCEQATEGNQYRLAFPISLRNLQTIIIAKIEILEKQ